MTGTPRPIRLLVVDDHPGVRAGLSSLLTTAGDIEIVATASDGGEAIALAAEHHPAVVLMDLSMPDVGGVEATRRIRAGDERVSVVILTASSHRHEIAAALRAGATGYVLKDAEPTVLIGAVRAAARGDFDRTYPGLCVA
jgi:DNA-binding NarL/FixJ family response regulator